MAGSICDLTGARIWATGPFTMTYGENPDKANAARGLDLGYTVLPNPGDWMDLVLTVDKSTNPVVVSSTAGATLVTYTLVVKSHEFNVDAVSVVDTLPANWAYQAGSTTITLPDLTTSPAPRRTPRAGPAPRSPGARASWAACCPTRRSRSVPGAHDRQLPANGALTRNQVQATGTRTVGGVTQTFNARDFVFNTYRDGTVNQRITKTSSVPQATPVSPGDTLTYTVTVSNPGTSTAPLTNVWINDMIPNGTSYVAGSGSVAGCCPAPRNVRDKFGSVALHQQQRLGELGRRLERRRTRYGRGAAPAGASRWSRAAPCASATPATNAPRRIQHRGQRTGNDGTGQLGQRLDRDERRWRSRRRTITADIATTAGSSSWRRPTAAP